MQLKIRYSTCISIKDNVSSVNWKVLLRTFQIYFFSMQIIICCLDEQEVNELHHLPHLLHPWLLLHLAQAQLKAARFVSEQASDLMQAGSGAETDWIHLAAGKEPRW